MIGARVRWLTLACVIGLVALLEAGCIVPDGGYGYGGAGIGADYYEPYGTVYGGWSPGYEVGPYRDGGHRGDAGRGGGGERGAAAPSHAFRAAPASRAAPSIPSAARSGGGRSGGGRR